MQTILASSFLLLFFSFLNRDFPAVVIHTYVYKYTIHVIPMGDGLFGDDNGSRYIIHTK